MNFIEIDTKYSALFCFISYSFLLPGYNALTAYWYTIYSITKFLKLFTSFKEKIFKSNRMQSKKILEKTKERSLGYNANQLVDILGYK